MLMLAFPCLSCPYVRMQQLENSVLGCHEMSFGSFTNVCRHFPIFVQFERLLQAHCVGLLVVCALK